MWYLCVGSTEINLADPQTKDDFDELRKRLVADLTRFEKRALFGDFLEDLIQDLCLFCKCNITAYCGMVVLCACNNLIFV